jgi:hypothetical protein
MFDQISISQIDREIVGAIGALEVEYKIHNNTWICPSNENSEEVHGSGNIIKSEAILCYLLPLYETDEESELGSQISAIVGLKELQGRVDAHLTGLKNPADFTGHPYLKIVDSGGKTHPFLDSYCFLISILIIYAKVFGVPKDPGKLKHFQGLFSEAIGFVYRSAVKNARGKYAGFFFTDELLPDAPYKYPTWMAIDTLSDLDAATLISFPFATEDCKKTARKLLEEVLPQIKEEYVRLYVNQDLLPDEVEQIAGRNLKLTEGLIKEDQDDNSPHYNLWATIILLYLGYDSGNTIREAFEVLRRYIEEEKSLRTQLQEPCAISFVSGNFPPGDQDENYLTDRSFLSQFVKGLSLFFRNYPQALQVESLRATFQKAFYELLKNRKGGILLWDKFAEKKAGYAIFQTERSIEALCSCRRLLLDLEKGKKERSVARFDAGAGWQEAILRHAIQLRIGEQDGRELVAREVRLEVERAIADKDSDLRQLIAGLQAEIDELKQGVKQKQSPAGKIKQMAIDAGITNPDRR